MHCIRKKKHWSVVEFHSLNERLRAKFERSETQMSKPHAIYSHVDIFNIIILAVKWNFHAVAN